jgi:putative ABC transport system permease protein
MSSGQAQYEEGLKQYEEGKATFEKEIADGEEQLKLARKKLEQLPSAHWYILDRDKMYSPLLYKNNTDQMASIGVYMPIMFYLVAALVCLTTMKRLVDEQRGQIGIYVALGYSNAQIIGKYVSYALLASLCGGVSGVIVGQLIFPPVVYTTWRMLYYLPEMIFSFPIRNALLSIAVFSLLMSIITAYTVNNMVKDSPASLMRPLAPRKVKELLIEKITFLWNSLSFTSKTTARNIFRYKSRFFMTIAGIAGCCGLLVLGFSIIDCVGDVLNIQYGKIFDYDCEVVLSSDEHLDKNIEILLEDPHVDKAEKYMLYTTKLYFGDYDNTANLIAVNSSDAKHIFGLYETDTKTPIRIDNNGIIVSEKLARNAHLKIGDQVTLESVNGIKADITVSNICEMYAAHYIFISDTAYMNLFDEKIKNNIIAVSCDDKQSLLLDCDRLEDFVSIMDFSVTKASFDNMIKALNLIMVVIIVVAGSLAFVVLVNLTQVNISERVREIATLKVLGFNDHEINMYIFKEIILLSFIGCLIGIPIGIFENRFIMSVISMEMIMFGKNIKTPSYFYAIGITMLFTVIVLLFMRKPLRKVDMVESLKSVE